MRTIFAAAAMTGVLLCAKPVVGQTGTLDVSAQITPTGGRPEPVRDFPLCALTKSYEEIKKEVENADPLPTRDHFIDGLPISQQLKDWMKKHQAIDLTQLDLDKMITTDDVMGVPEFLAAYQRSNSGGVTNGMPVPKFREADREANPAKYEKAKEDYANSLKKFIASHPATINGIELELGAVSPKLAWDKLQVDHRRRVAQLAPDTAQSKYLAGRADTNLEGRATFSGLSPGDYWISSLGTDAASGDRHLHWDVQTKVQAGQTTRVTLSNANGIDANGATP
jgi:hypothetical protein